MLLTYVVWMYVSEALEMVDKLKKNFGKIWVTLTTNVLQVRVGNGKVGCEHGGGNFATVVTIADETVEETRAMGWLDGVSATVSRVDSQE